MLRCVKYGLHGTVVAGLIAAPVVWNSVEKSVQLSVDGKVSTVQTTAGTVQGVLTDQGYRATSHDLLAPSAASKTSDGMRVVLRRGRLLHLSVDGKQTSVWTTAPTVQVALSQLGYTTSDVASVSRARRLPLKPTEIAIRTPRLVTVVHDGTRDMVTTTDTTVAQILDDLDVTVDSNDLVSAPISSAPTPGQILTVQRVSKRTVTGIKKIKYRVKTSEDPSRDKGNTHIVRAGTLGKARVIYSVVYIDGAEVGRTQLSSITVTQPKAQLVEVGTKKLVKPANTPDAGEPDPGSSKAIAKRLLPKYGFGAPEEYDCLVSMWTRESGWRVNAANPSGAYGIPQSLPGSKMASAGPDWQTDAATQIKWGLGYIKDRYNTPCGAWTFWQGHNYY